MKKYNTRMFAVCSILISVNTAEALELADSKPVSSYRRRIANFKLNAYQVKRLKLPTSKPMVVEVGTNKRMTLEEFSTVIADDAKKKGLPSPSAEIFSKHVLLPSESGTFIDPTDPGYQAMACTATQTCDKIGECRDWHIIECTTTVVCGDWRTVVRSNNASECNSR